MRATRRARKPPTGNDLRMILIHCARVRSAHPGAAWGGRYRSSASWVNARARCDARWASAALPDISSAAASAMNA